MLTLVFAIGSVLLVVGGGWLFTLAFAESILWGLGTLLFWPAVPIAFALTTWPRARIPLYLHFVGVSLVMAGGIVWVATSAQGLF
jgi:hypothetical protein